MNKEELRIVYMGTPQFAVEPLRCLVENGYHVVGVITMPDKPAGRGYKICYSPVKQYALEHNLPLLQPIDLKNPDFIGQLRQLEAHLQVVVAFRMLPQVVWQMPVMGTFNLHASLLPQYRGAAPINWAIINGETQTGLTTFFLRHEIDTGDIIRQQTIPINEKDNAGIIHDKLMNLGGDLVIRTIEDILSGNITPIPQETVGNNMGILHGAPKIFKDTCRINWDKSVKAVYDHIRGLSPYPGAWTQLIYPDGQSVIVKIFEGSKIQQWHDFPTGMIQTDGKKYMRVTVKDGFLEVLSLQLPGKKRLAIQDFLRGFSINNQYKMS